MTADPIRIKHILLEHKQKFIVEEENSCRIHIRHAHLFEDAFRFFCKESNDGSKMVRIIFIGEAAVDNGGPRREFFKLLMHDIAKRSGLFLGLPDHITPLHNVEALERNKYYVVGKMLAICIVQGGQPPVYFSSPVSDYLYDRVNSSVEIDDISDFNVKQNLNKVYTSMLSMFCYSFLLIADTES